MEQYFTPPATAQLCVQKLLEVLPGSRDQYHWIDAGSGKGTLSNELPPTVKSLRRVELDPQLASDTGAECCDFFKWKSDTARRNTIVLSNPPYNTGVIGDRRGRRCRGCVSTAHKFAYHALTLADTIAFIVTASWLRPDYRSLIKAPLIYAQSLGVIKFDVGQGKTKPVRVSLMVWSRVFPVVNISILPPPSQDTHEDFEFLTPDKWRESDMVVNRWGSVGRIEPLNSPPSAIHLKHNLRNGGTRFYMKVRPGKEALLKQTCAWVRERWPMYSPGNNANIGSKALCGVHAYLHDEVVPEDVY